MEESKPNYTIHEKVEGIPQMLKLAPVFEEPPPPEPTREFPLKDLVQKYPGKNF